MRASVGDSILRPGPRTWLVSFGVAILLGFCNAYQVWLAHGAGRPFWSARLIQPQLIPWLVWASIIPLLFVVLDRVDTPASELRARALRYAAIGIAAIAIQASLTALALGFWWAFPSLVPMDPLWHVRDQLRTRIVLGILVFSLVVAIYRLSRRAVVVVKEVENQPSLAVAAAPVELEARPALVSLKVGDRIVLVDPMEIDLVEADRDYVIVYRGSAQYRIRQSIGAMESRLTSSHVRISRSVIVNLKAVNEIQPWFRGDRVLILKNGKRVTTGAKFRERLTSRI